MMFPRVWGVLVMVIHITIIHVTLGQYAKFTELQGNNVCTAIVRTIYVPAYRELSTIEYRVVKVCCAGYEAADEQCVTSTSGGPGATTTTIGIGTAAPTINDRRSGGTPRHDQAGIDRDQTRQGERERLPTQPLIPRAPPNVGDVGIAHYDGSARNVADGSHHVAGRENVFVDDKTILTRDDYGPESYHPYNGSGMVGLALGVGVVMSLTGVLVGVVIMKFRMRKLTAMDVKLLTRDRYSRRPTRRKSQTVCEALSKRKQKPRVVSYVDVMDVRDKMVPDQQPQQPATTKKIPQCSLPRIPEAETEPTDGGKHPNEQQDDVLELNEVRLIPTSFPPYAVVKRVSKSSDGSSIRHSSFATAFVLYRSNSSAYADVDDLTNDVVVGSNLPVSTRSSYSVGSHDDERETAFNSLYAKVNRNKNSNNEHNRRFSHGTTISNSGVYEDYSIDGSLERPLSQAGGFMADNSYLKYDRLKRGPQPRSTRISKRFSELYECI